MLFWNIQEKGSQAVSLVVFKKMFEKLKKFELENKFVGLGYKFFGFGYNNFVKLQTKKRLNKIKFVEILNLMKLI